MKRYFAGIDNGLDGGIVVLDEAGTISHREPIPTIKEGKSRRIDVTELDVQLSDLGNLPVSVCVEPAQSFSPGKSALCSTWRSWGLIESLLILRQIQYETVNPRKWQREFWTTPKMPKGKKFDTKAAALLAASKLWPSENWTKSDRSTKPHDGMIDAALIAEYWRRRAK